jgi:Flp pilus assembly protein TadD
MRSNSALVFSLVVCVAWLSGCTAPAQRPVESQPAATPTGAPSAGKASVIDPLAMREHERALAAMKAKRNAQAERILLAMTRSYSQFAGPHMNLGIIYHRTGRDREAEQAFRQAIAISPERADAYNHLGIVLRENGRFSEAREAYENALKVDPSYAYAYLNLGILYDLYLLDAKKALKHYELYQKLVSTPDPGVAKWVVDLRRRMKRNQKTAGR